LRGGKIRITIRSHKMKAKILPYEANEVTEITLCDGFSYFEKGIGQLHTPIIKERQQHWKRILIIDDDPDITTTTTTLNVGSFSGT